MYASLVTILAVLFFFLFSSISFFFCLLLLVVVVVIVFVFLIVAGVTKMYEARLKEVNPQQVHITYDITDLYGFIDELGDLSALV